MRKASGTMPSRAVLLTLVAKGGYGQTSSKGEGRDCWCALRRPQRMGHCGQMEVGGQLRGCCSHLGPCRGDRHRGRCLEGGEMVRFQSQDGEANSAEWGPQAGGKGGEGIPGFGLCTWVGGG